MVDEERVRELASAIQRQATRKLRNLWWAFLIRGISVLGLAFVALLWPELTIQWLIRILGVYLLIDSIPHLYVAWRGERKVAPLLAATLSIGIGLVLIFWSSISAKVFLVMVGIWLMFQGGSLLLTSRRVAAGEPERGPLAAVGALLAVVGLVLIFWPQTGVVAVSWLIAICSAVIGTVLIFLATRFRRWQYSLARVSLRA